MHENDPSSLGPPIDGHQKKLSEKFPNIFTFWRRLRDLWRPSVSRTEEVLALDLVKYEVVTEDDPDNAFVHNPALPYTPETIPTNWYSKSDMSFAVSGAGFHHNLPAHRYLGLQLAHKLRLSSDSKVLEFGCGSNYSVAEGIKVESGAQVLLLDKIDTKGTYRETGEPVDTGEMAPGNIPVHFGDIADVHAHGSVLKHMAGTIDAVIQHGAMFSFGNNFTVSLEAEAQYYKARGDRLEQPEPEKNKFIQEYYRRVIEATKHLLAPGGTFFFTSSRFANHGAGYPPLRLHEEKIQFLNFIDLLKEAGAKKVTIYGVSDKTLRANVEHMLGTSATDFRSLRQALLRSLLKPFPSFQLSRQSTSGGRERIPISELVDMVRDDASFQRLLESPTVLQFATEKAQQYWQELQDELDWLCGPVANLPEESEIINFDVSQLPDIKARNSDFPLIARIDAVAVQF
ncbi:hypothetical protein KBC79_02720 [Candidatus Woesebacteria bacterium]|nr:hypothetical protein [Candidatus Woesebacteria bacterium]